ncbi:uncharacterized protein DNG_08756 [Cephalotrichum gorgonifer]|uniref:Poly [ADP-ribose] polymerase n=1 Tax=Cephalotrichum gorgonifer TaxID=2041049 RepID=A0AAE8N4R4_9PEZI|nr:uncharacterized protein DNG_08756 [Cephalotrichum gorgonifer]
MAGWDPDPPGTIAPFKLSLPSPPQAAATPVALGSTSQAVSPRSSTRSPTPAKLVSLKERRVSNIPGLPRISSDCNSEDEMLTLLPSSMRNLHPIRQEFDNLPGVHGHRANKRMSPNRRYFRSQTDGAPNLHIPADPEAGEDVEIVVDADTCSIYDAFLLSVDVTRDVNSFKRLRVGAIQAKSDTDLKVDLTAPLQVCFSPRSGKYTLTVRSGRVGSVSPQSVVMESDDLREATASFRRSFRRDTGVKWENRYRYFPNNPVWGVISRSRRPAYPRKYVFIELDYRKPALGNPGLPAHHLADTSVPLEVRGLMEDMLYGERTATAGDAGVLSIDVLSAPLNQLSSWTVFQAFRTLQRILGYLGSGRPVQWKSIQHASSIYRSLIPYCSGKNKPPVISNHLAVFCELGLLHSLWPWHGINDLRKRVYLRGSLQTSTSLSLARPLYHAYSSLPHGFRRLADESTTEFQRLMSYIDKSCQPSHGLSLEVKEIYRVFVKAGVQNPYQEWIESNKPTPADGGDEMRVLLWHGTPLDSLLGILDLGLQIRRKGASLTGSMFGNGIYLADSSSKSVGYCRSGQWKGEAVLLLCEVDIGTLRKSSTTSIDNAHVMAASGSVSWRCVQGLGKTGPKKFVAVDWPLEGDPQGGTVLMPDVSAPYSDTGHFGSLSFNEYVVYNAAHVLIRYIFRLKVGHARRWG